MTFVPEESESSSKDIENVRLPDETKVSDELCLESFLANNLKDNDELDRESMRHVMQRLNETTSLEFRGYTFDKPINVWLTNMLLDDMDFLSDVSKTSIDFLQWYVECTTLHLQLEFQHPGHFLRERQRILKYARIAFVRDLDGGMVEKAAKDIKSSLLQLYADISPTMLDGIPTDQTVPLDAALLSRKKDLDRYVSECAMTLVKEHSDPVFSEVVSKFFMISGGVSIFDKKHKDHQKFLSWMIHQYVDGMSSGFIQVCMRNS